MSIPAAKDEINLRSALLLPADGVSYAQNLSGGVTAIK